MTWTAFDMMYNIWIFFLLVEPDLYKVNGLEISCLITIRKDNLEHCCEYSENRVWKCISCWILKTIFKMLTDMKLYMISFKSQCSDYNIDMHFCLSPAKIHHNITLIWFEKKSFCSPLSVMKRKEREGEKEKNSIKHFL